MLMAVACHPPFVFSEIWSLIRDSRISLGCPLSMIGLAVHKVELNRNSGQTFARPMDCCLKFRVRALARYPIHFHITQAGQTINYLGT